MKRIIFSLTFLVCLSLMSSEVSAQKNTTNNSSVEVLYFHSKQRCMTCRAIEKVTRDALSQYFAKEMKAGKVKFRVIDISLPQNEKIAEKYQVTWSSLYINQWKGRKEQVNNLTEQAFANARTNPDKFKSIVRQKVLYLLK